MNVSVKISLDGVQNARDLGGITNKNGYRISTGKLIRSSELSKASDRDMKRLYDEYDVRTIIDFRSVPEKEEAPDRSYPGIQYILNDIIGGEAFGITRDTQSIEKMRQIEEEIQKNVAAAPSLVASYAYDFYRDFARSGQSIKQYGRFLSYIIDAEGAVLWHCAMGKDRCGIGTVLVLELLDVDRETIIADYLYSNICLYGEGSSQMEFAFDNVRREYLEAFYEQVEAQYGSVTGLFHEMGISEATKARFKKKYLIEP